MREIKFKAWDMIENRMRYWDFYDKEILNDSIYDVHNTIIMQYTGLKDKNGVEIYEGDIVKWHVNDVVRIGIVEYPKNFGGYDLKNLNDDFHVCCDWLRGEYEVIGNRFENPELLNS